MRPPPAGIIALLLVVLAGGVSAHLPTIHIVAHSHCDPGWLETYQTYFRDDVRVILSNVMAELRRSPSRKFIWSETSFFRLWYDELEESERIQFQELVQSGRFEFVNGGWVQNDEACPDSIDIISHTTEGHKYLYDRFGIIPRYGWQIDPFGHSALTPALFRLFGYNAMVINRIDYRYKAALKEKRLMEFIWRGTDLGGQQDLFTHVLHTHYSAPQGYDWEGMSEPVGGHNIERMASGLVQAMLDRLKSYQTDHLLVPFGDDFKFKRAADQFSNMDRIIAHINSHTDQYGVRIQYSTLSDYFEAVARCNATFVTLSGDFFPYADNADSFWTGFYTTRPQLKRILRRVSSTLRAADLLTVLARARLAPNVTDPLYDGLVEARRDAALFLHHDAVTGTARDHVVQDYMERMTGAYDTAMTVVEHLTTELMALPDQFDGQWRMERDKGATLPTGLHAVTVLNSVAWSRTELICSSVSTAFVSVRDQYRNVIKRAQIHATWAEWTDPGSLPSTYELCFMAELDPVSISVFMFHVYEHDQYDDLAEIVPVHVVSHAEIVNHDTDQVKFRQLRDDPETQQLLRLRNGLVEVQLSCETGLITSVTNRESDVTISLFHEFRQYTTHESGAYIFRPDHGPEPVSDLINAEPIIRVIHGTVMSRATIHLGQYAVQVDVLSDRSDIGLNMDVTAGDNREIVTRFRTSIKSADEFYSTNGVDFVRRRRRPQDPTPSNYYPAVSGGRIRDDQVQLTVLTGHTSGVTSPQSGVLEFMIHRSLLQDDGRGLNQAVIDHSTVPITMRLLMESISDQMTSYRRLQIDIDTPPIVMYPRSNTPVQWPAVLVPVKMFDPVLADDLHLLSIQARDRYTDDIVIRFENVNDHNIITIDLTALCCSSTENNAQFQHIREATLSAVHEFPDADGMSAPMYRTPPGALAFAASGLVVPINLADLTASDLRQDRQNADEEGVFISDIALEKAAGQRKLLSAPDEGSVTIGPRQLRTFIVTLRHLTDDPVEMREMRSARQKTTQKQMLLPGAFEVVAIGLISTTVMIAAFIMAKYSVGTWPCWSPKEIATSNNKHERHLV